MLCRLFANLNLVRDVGIEPTSSRLKGECISLSANPAGIEPAWSRLAQSVETNSSAHRMLFPNSWILHALFATLARFS